MSTPDQLRQEATRLEAIGERLAQLRQATSERRIAEVAWEEAVHAAAQVGSKTEVAEAAGISRPTLYDMLKKAEEAA